ncbi:MFS transporter [Brachybacterium sp. AOP25-B2-12]|uniref:MFS transporter n=1 Tax=Brachybacterium sp. AOP25-B2-12 TaxID=3457710 RepID=UPI004033648C
MASVRSDGGARPGGTAGLGVGLLVAVLSLQFVQGVLGAFHTPLLAPMARTVGMRDADWNLFDSGTAAVSALALPVLTWLGDRWGHRRLVVVTVVLVAAAAWLSVAATSVWTLFLAFAVLGVATVWVPFALAIARGRLSGDVGAGLARLSSAMVTVFMVGSVLATAAGGQLLTRSGAWSALQEGLAAGNPPSQIPVFREGLVLVLAIPAALTTLAIPCALLLPRPTPQPSRAPGALRPRSGQFLGTFTLGLIVLGIVGGFALLKLEGSAAAIGWILIVVGGCAAILHARWQTRTTSPAIDVAALRDLRCGPYVLALGLFAICHTAASVPLVTFVATDRERTGYGLSATPADVSLIMLTMILVIIGVAAILARVRTARTRLLLIRQAPVLIAAEYTWFLLHHDVLWHALVAAVLGGLGAGVLSVGLTAMIAAGAPPGRTAQQVGLAGVVSITGGTIGSAVFAIVLHDGAGGDATAAPYAGYVIVWILALVCALATAVVLWFARDPTRDPSLGHLTSTSSAPAPLTPEERPS